MVRHGGLIPDHVDDGILTKILPLIELIKDVFVLHSGPDALPKTWWALLLSRLWGRPVRSSRGQRYLLVCGADPASMLRSMVKWKALLPLGAEAREDFAFGSTDMSMSVYSGE
jgi:hypothetical protein